MSKSRPVEFFVVDILVAADKIRRYAFSFDNAQTFFHDEKSFDASMRELQIIGEATKKLLHAGLLDDDYRIIVDFRNVIVHEYFGIDAEEIWDIVHNELPRFAQTVLKLAIEQCNPHILSEVIDAAISVSATPTRRYLNQLKQHLTQ